MQKYKIAKLWVIGSILTPHFNEESDVDFSVSFDKSQIDLPDYMGNYFDFAISLNEISQ